MKFEQIFKAEGLYVADSFSKGVAFKIIKNSIDGRMELFMVSYQYVSDISPTITPMLVYGDLFDKEYALVYNRGSLFK